MRTNNLSAAMLKEGHLFGLKGLISRTVDPESPKARWDALTRKEQEQLSQIANEYGGRYELSRNEMKTLGVSDKVVDAYKAFVNAYSKAIDDINLTRGDNPINKLPGYFPKLREGDFKLSVIDKATGDTVYSDLFWTKFGRGRVEAKLKKDFGDQYEIKTDVVDRGQRGNPYNVATVPFEELMDTIGRNDPRYRAIESAVREIKGKRGFGRHAIHRRNIAGGELDPSNFYKAFESYVDSAYRYKSNVEMKKLGSEFQYDMDISAPNLKNWVNTYVDLASGRFKPGWLVDSTYKLAETLTKGLTLGQTGSSVPSKVLQQLNNYFMWKALFAYRPAFLAAQGVQPYAFAPQWIAHYETKGYKGGGISGATYDATKMMVTRPEDFKAFIRDYMVPRGGIDPTMIHQMDFFGTNEGSAARAGRWITGHAPAQLIESLGRLETAALGYAFFKKAGLKGKELHAAAERFVNDVMVDYTKQEQPSWVGRTGIIGQAAGPLSTFFTNFASTTMLFMKDIAANPGKAISYKPMAIHIAQTAIWAGLTGTLGTKLVDTLIEIFKAMKVLDPKFPTASEAIMSSDIPDIAAFGVVSGLSGMNIGASMAAPDIHAPSANTFPGIKFLADATTSLWPIVNPFGPSSTIAQRQQFMKTFLPNYVASMMDVYEVVPDTGFGITMRRREPGEVVPNTNKRGFGNTAPTAEDQTARMLGTRSLRETRELEGVRKAQKMQELSNASKTQLVDLAVDSIMYGEKANHDIGELVAKAGEAGMPPDDFITAVRKAMMNRMSEAETRSVGQSGPRSPAAVQRYEIIEGFKGKDSGFKKMGGGEQQYPEKGHAGIYYSNPKIIDEAFSARKEKEFKNAKRESQVGYTEVKLLMSLAKKLYPNDLEKQINYVKNERAKQMVRRGGTHRDSKKPQDILM
jgi:hypothetical protein